MNGPRLLGPQDSLAAALGERLAGLSPEHAGVLILRPVARERGTTTPDLAAAEKWLNELSTAPPARLILISSAAASEPHHYHPGFAREGLVSRPSPHPITRRWQLLEQRVRELCPAGTRLLVLRPAPVLCPDSGELLPRLLRRRLVFPAWGFDPSMQLLSLEDFVGGVAAAMTADLEGTYHLAPPGTLSLRRALREAGVWWLPLPAGFLRLGRRILRALTGSGEPAEVDALCWPATLDGTKLAHDSGFTPAKTSLGALCEAKGKKELTTEPDDFGMSESYIRSYGRTLFRFLERLWWRIEVRGVENVPRQGGALLVGIHRGLMPWDGVMTLHTLRRNTGRITRFLIHPCLVKMPFLANYMTKLGGVIACRDNADRLLAKGELLGYYPEGIHGAFTMYKDAYRLGKFGRDEFVRAALRNQAPIVPFVTLGSAEIFPIFARVEWGWWKRTTEWLFFPITPTFPLAPIPLPSKWHMEFLEPIDVAALYPPEAADDPRLVRAISAEVRARLQTALDALRAKRRHIFWGSVFERQEMMVLETDKAAEQQARGL